ATAGLARDGDQTASARRLGCGLAGGRHADCHLFAGLEPREDLGVGIVAAADLDADWSGLAIAHHQDEGVAGRESSRTTGGRGRLANRTGRGARVGRGLPLSLTLALALSLPIALALTLPLTLALPLAL